MNFYMVRNETIFHRQLIARKEAAGKGGGRWRYSGRHDGRRRRGAVGARGAVPARVRAAAGNGKLKLFNTWKKTF